MGGLIGGTNNTDGNKRPIFSDDGPVLFLIKTALVLVQSGVRTRVAREMRGNDPIQQPLKDNGRHIFAVGRSAAGVGISGKSILDGCHDLPSEAGNQTGGRYNRTGGQVIVFRGVLTGKCIWFTIA